MSLKAKMLNTVRRGREIAWVPDWMRTGNLLYMGLWASESPDRKVLLHGEHAGLLTRIAPHMLETFFLPRSAVRFTDQRVMPWSGKKETSGRFNPPALRQFVEGYVLPRSEILASPVDLSNTMVVNVRRGDYYSVPKHEAEFGMDQIAFVRAAVKRSIGSGRPQDRFVVISDDQEWCRENLGPVLSEHGLVSYPDGDPVHDLAILVHAERLVIPNSTFSYWGGYIGDVLKGEREVYAPMMFSRTRIADQLRPNWIAISDGTTAAEE